MMKDAGINVVRMGESSWGLWEPRGGEVRVRVDGRIVDRMHRAGIKVVMGTPTYSVPAWLYRKHPEILVTRLGGRAPPTACARTWTSPTRPTSSTPSASSASCSNTTKTTPAIIGWQVDNETTSYGTAGPNVQAGFADHLKGSSAPSKS